MRVLRHEFSNCYRITIMLNDKSDSMLSNLVERLRGEFDPCRIYLFGSRAADSAQPESDFDCLVIVPETTESHFERQVRGQTALRGFPHSVDLLIYTDAEWEELSLKQYSVARQVRDRGRLLHAA